MIIRFLIAFAALFVIVEAKAEVLLEKRQVAASIPQVSATLATTSPVSPATAASFTVSPASASLTASSAAATQTASISSVLGSSTGTTTASPSSTVSSFDPPLPSPNPANANSQWPRLVDFSPNTMEVFDRPRTNTSNVFTIKLKKAPSAYVIVYFASDDLQLSSCMFVFDNATWDQPQTLRVTPGSLTFGDIFNDSHVVKLSARLLSMNDTGFPDSSYEWVGYRRRVPGRSCLSVPHVYTFDRLGYHYTAPGTYYLVNSGALSVQLVQFGCLGGSLCTAAVSIRFGRTVLVLDTRGTNGTSAAPEWKSNGPINNYVRPSLDENVWNVRLPDGGSRISILHHTLDYGGPGIQHWLTVAVNLAPGWNGVTGLCNSMMSDGSVFSCGDGKTVPGNRSRLMTNMDDCVKTWSVPDNDNHFNLQSYNVPLDDFPGSQCRQLPDTPVNTTLSFQDTPPSYTALTGLSGPQDDNMRTASKQGDIPPRFTVEAKLFCERLMLIPGCSNILHSRFFMMACERELVTSGLYEKAESLKQSLLLQCRVTLDYLSNDTFTDSQKHAQVIQRLWNFDSCPNDCSGNGKCTKTIGCSCNDGFTGADCSINIRRFVAYNPDTKSFTDGNVTYSPNEPPVNLTAGAVSSKVGSMINNGYRVDSPVISWLAPLATILIILISC